MEQTQEVKYAGFWIRILAGILDIIFLLPPIIIVSYILGIDLAQYVSQMYEIAQNPYVKPQFDKFDKSVDMVIYFLSISYLTYFVAAKGQATPGKSILKLYVGNRDGSKLTSLKSLLRALASILNAFTVGLGFLPVAFTKEKVSLHDWLCGTRVFRR